MGGPPGGGAPPWIDSTVQQGVEPRDGDIWISVPVKSGTNWMMNVVYQLLSGGDDQFESIYGKVPWPELVEYPGQDQAEVLDRIEALPKDRRRAFKSHSAPPDLPFIKAGEGEDVRYVVVCRNPEEALVSFKVFLEKHTDEFYDMWKVPKVALTRPDFPAFYHEVIDDKGMQGMLFGFIAAWWPLRHEPNVLMLHFADMKKDLPGTARKVARFLGIEPSESEWARIDAHTTFDWMKQHQSKFETWPQMRVPVLETGAMIRKGKVGAASEDGMTPEIAAHLRQIGSRICSDEAVLKWFYEGGPLP